MYKTKLKKRGFRAIQVLTILAILAATFCVAPKAVTAASDAANRIFDISEGPISISQTGDTILVTYGSSITVSGIPSGTQLTIIGSSPTDGILVSSTSSYDINITLEGVSIDSICALAITSNANVHLTLSGDNTLESRTGFAGLGVASTSALTINGTGSLTATGGDNGAGIGGGNGAAPGPISINGGTITAYGGTGAAGIGGGNGGLGGTLLIADGSIEATGGKNAAGIGGGSGSGGGDITIIGGAINTTGGLRGAGIGGGYDGASSDTAIKILGSAFIVNAQGGDAEPSNGDPGSGAGAGIGTGGSGGTAPLAPDPDSIIISSGVDLARVSGGIDAGAFTAGAPIGSGGAKGADSVPYDSHTITYHDSKDPETTQDLTYTVNTGLNDAVLPALEFVQLHNPAFAPVLFDGYWHETRTGNGPHGVGMAFSSTSIFDLYAFGEPKTGL